MILFFILLRFNSVNNIRMFLLTISKKMSCSMVNVAFLNYLNFNYSNFVAIYTDGLVSPLSNGYAFYIPKSHISFTNNLPPPHNRPLLLSACHHRSPNSYLTFCSKQLFNSLWLYVLSSSLKFQSLQLSSIPSCSRHQIPLIQLHSTTLYNPIPVDPQSYWDPMETSL